MFRKYLILGAFLILLAACSQQNKKVELGRLQTGVTVSFVNTSEGEWGIETSGTEAPRILQMKPARLEIFRTDKDVIELSVGYQKVKKSDSGIEAQAEIAYGEKVVFRVNDYWSLTGDVVSVKREVVVEGDAPDGFSSSVVFAVDSSSAWTDVNYLAPGAIYGDPTFDGDRSPGGTLNYKARRFIMREDILPAPLFALSFNNGYSVAVLDPSPNGQSTVEETKLSKAVMIDSLFQFGALGAWQENEKPIEFGFIFPGKSSIFSRDSSQVEPQWFRRYHPINEGVSHQYEVRFRFGQNESFRDVTQNSWRWAWNTLNPPITTIDIEQMRRVLTDHLLSQANTINGRTGIPFAVATFDTCCPQWNANMTGMGFVSKNIECADQLLREGDRDKTERGQKMRKTGLGIISSMIHALDKVPLQATGYDLATGKPWVDHVWLAPWLRNAVEDMRVLVRAYQREKKMGNEHPEWFSWVKNYTDWLLLQQREDGSFPRRWKSGTDEVVEATGTTSYSPVPLLVLLTEETGNQKYLQSAIRAAEYIWVNWGERGLYIGGASDNPNITDKEAGMLSMEAFLSLYEATKEPKWLERAQAAANFTESWIWIWNLPMPVDAVDSKLHWKKGVSTIGLQGITARTPGGTDEYLDWAVPSYAKLYKYTHDEHYLEVARLLLHDTKSMVALPGRQYDMRGFGWQQENFRLGPGGSGRGVGGHRFWLPWVSANHLYGITGLEEFDTTLYKRLSNITD